MPDAKPVFLNWRGPDGLETVDEFTREPGQTARDFRAYVADMVREYHRAGMAVYTSTRPCRDWLN